MVCNARMCFQSIDVILIDMLTKEEKEKNRRDVLLNQQGILTRELKQNQKMFQYI
jgi:uncharacterized protein YbgA (DUF1722 family)